MWQRTHTGPHLCCWNYGTALVFVRVPLCKAIAHEVEYPPMQYQNEICKLVEPVAAALASWSSNCPAVQSSNIVVI